LLAARLLGTFRGVNGFFYAFDTAAGVLRLVIFVLAAVLFVLFAMDWLVRTRRINPFHPVARFFRRTVDPIILPVERRVVRAGGLPSSAPWWALVAVVVGGILLIVALDFLRELLYTAFVAAGAGTSGLYYLLVRWTFGILRLALFVRIIASWLRLSEFKPWIRWSVALTEWLLRPLRSFIPPLGMIDVTPIVAYLVLWMLEGIMLRLA
jgi:YggT family protein